jgi:hypothetical protein
MQAIMRNNADDLDKRVRAEVYDATMRRGAPPRSSEVAKALGTDQKNVRESFARLASAHVIVLQPESGEILMANPFSAVPTPFHVETSGMSAYGNCIWDALGIPAMLNADATIHTSCADCGIVMQIQVTRGSVSGKGLLHFAIPAREWWNDIVFT